MRLIYYFGAGAASALRILCLGALYAPSVVPSGAATYSDEHCVAHLSPALGSFVLRWDEVPTEAPDAVLYRVYRTVGSETELVGETSGLTYYVSDYASADVTIQVKWVDEAEVETDYCSIAIPRYELLYAEYFVGSDPGPGNGVEIPLESDGTEALELSFDVGAVANEGMTSVYTRYHDSRDHWSIDLVARIMVTPRLVGENYSLMVYSETAGDWVPVESIVGEGDQLSFGHLSGVEGIQKPTFMLQSDEGHFSFPETLIYLSEKQAEVDGAATLDYRVSGNGNTSVGSVSGLRVEDGLEALLSPNSPVGEDYAVSLEMTTRNGFVVWPLTFPIDVVLNEQLVASAGGNRVVYEYDGDNRALVKLDASESTDLGGAITKYLWEWGNESVEGESVQLDLPLGVTMVRLTVFDESQLGASDEISVEVVDLDSDDDGLQDSFERYIADSDPNDSIRVIEDVRPKGDFDGDGYRNIREQSNLTDPTIITIPSENEPEMPRLRITRNPDGSLRFEAILLDKGHFRLLSGELGVDVALWELLAEGDFENELFEHSRQESEKASFFSLSVEGEPEPVFEGIIDDEEGPVEVFQIESSGLPWNLSPDTEYDLTLSQVEGTPGQARINGEYAFRLIDLLDGEPVAFDYSIDPTFVNFVDGIAASKIRIQTDASLYNVGVVLEQAIVNVSSVGAQAEGKGIFWNLQVDTDGLPLVSEYQAASAQVWNYPSKITYPISGTFAEYPGHKSLHWGVDLAMLKDSYVYPANKGIVVFAGGTIGSVLIDHGNGYLSKYLHVNPIVKYGAIVDVNTAIATVKTSSPVHLHFELWEASPTLRPKARTSSLPGSGENPLNPLAAEGLSWSNGTSRGDPWRAKSESGSRIQGIYLSSLAPAYGDQRSNASFTGSFTEESESAYLVVSAVEQQSGFVLGMREVRFSEEDADGQTVEKELGFFSKSQVEALGLPSATTAGVTSTSDRSERYRYWFKWDLSAEEQMSGPREFSVRAVDNQGEGEERNFYLGPQFQDVPDKAYVHLSTEELVESEFSLELASINGPYPKSQKVGFFEDVYSFGVAFKSEIEGGPERKVFLKNMASGSPDWVKASEFELTPTPGLEYESHRIGVKIEDHLGVGVPAEDLMLVGVRSKKIPNIGHEIEIPIIATGKGLVLREGFLDWNLITDGRKANAEGVLVGDLRDQDGTLTADDFNSVESDSRTLATAVGVRMGNSLNVSWDATDDSFDLNVLGNVDLSSGLSEFGPTSNFIKAKSDLYFSNNSGGVRDVEITMESYLDNIFYTEGNPWPLSTQTFPTNDYNGDSPLAFINILSVDRDYAEIFDLEDDVQPQTTRIPGLQPGQGFLIKFLHVGMNYNTRTRTTLKINVKLVAPAPE